MSAPPFDPADPPSRLVAQLNGILAEYLAELAVRMVHAGPAEASAEQDGWYAAATWLEAEAGRIAAEAEGTVQGSFQRTP